MPSLSVCVFSDRSSARLAAVVSPLRAVADEIVIAVDERKSDQDFTVLDGLADEIVVARFVWPLEANLEWLHAQCSGDWVFRIDGDEVVSSALVDVLAGDDWHRDATHGYVPRRWLFDEGSSWITSNPWWPDPQLRLVKNEIGLLEFGTSAHEVVKVDGPGIVLGGSIYHLDLIDTDLGARRAKSRTYARAHPGLRTHGGLAMGVYYTPELLTQPPRTAPVPEVDRPNIDAAIRRDASIARRVPLGSVIGPTPTYPARSALVEVENPDSRGYAGRGVELLATVANNGHEALIPYPASPFRLGCQWLTSDGIAVPGEARSDLARALEPGATAVVSMVAEIPTVPGNYRLSVGALDEEERWLARAPDIEFVSLEQPRIALVAGISRHRHLGDDLVVRSLIEELANEFPHIRLNLLADDPLVTTERFGIDSDPAATRIEDADASPRLTSAASVQRVVAAARSYLADGIVEDESIAGLADVIAGSDMLIILAAGSLASAYVDAALWPRLAEAEIADAAGVPVAVTSAGIGPFTSDEHRDAARRLLGIAREVHVRDRLAREALVDLNVVGPTIIVVPDAASGVRGVGGPEFAAFASGNGLDLERPYIVVSARPEDDSGLIEQIAKSAEVASRSLDAAVVLVPHCASDEVDDRPVLDRIAELVGRAADVVNMSDIPPDALAADLLRNAHVSIGTRFHNAVLSASAERPAILFCATDYDRQRALGLAELSGTAIEVISGSARRLSRRTRVAVNSTPGRLRYPQPHPLMTLIHALGIARRSTA